MLVVCPVSYVHREDLARLITISSTVLNSGTMPHVNTALENRNNTVARCSIAEPEVCPILKLKIENARKTSKFGYSARSETWTEATSMKG